MKTYEVTYTKKIGGDGSILVKAENEVKAIENAKFLCATGSNFRNPSETEKEYKKPRKQGFAGRH